ncbi:hypothetical protein SCHPADRAFT_896969 [Schizopora paradoxa]|uniref:Uncharacterized protein n=1 Tax=Schizopora paradoxa TaxID=27342 RepID=A0A0H2QZU3_9AGAM|nr:hypothetical protein SCHPADRAFT_896969 [Schizopora paradoxa]
MGYPHRIMFWMKSTIKRGFCDESTVTIQLTYISSYSKKQNWPKQLRCAAVAAAPGWNDMAEESQKYTGVQCPVTFARYLFQFIGEQNEISVSQETLYYTWIFNINLIKTETSQKNFTRNGMLKTEGRVNSEIALTKQKVCSTCKKPTRILSPVVLLPGTFGRRTGDPLSAIIDGFGGSSGTRRASSIALVFLPLRPRKSRRDPRQWPAGSAAVPPQHQPRSAPPPSSSHGSVPHQNCPDKDAPRGFQVIAVPQHIWYCRYMPYISVIPRPFSAKRDVRSRKQRGKVGEGKQPPMLNAPSGLIPPLLHTSDAELGRTCTRPTQSPLLPRTTRLTRSIPAIRILYTLNMFVFSCGHDHLESHAGNVRCTSDIHPEVHSSCSRNPPTTFEARHSRRLVRREILASLNAKLKAAY